MRFEPYQKYRLCLDKDLFNTDFYDTALGLSKSVVQCTAAQSYILRNFSIFLCLARFSDEDKFIYHFLSLSDLTLFSGHSGFMWREDFKSL
jgi:hypothetical protein